MSLATDENTGGIIAAIEARFAAQDAARMAELDRLIREGVRYCICDRRLSNGAKPGDDCGRKQCLKAVERITAAEQLHVQTSAPTNPSPTRIEPAQPVAPTENTIPKGIARGEACPKCKSTGTRHFKTCPDAEGATAPGTTKPPAKLAPSKPAAKPRAVPARRAARYDEDLEILDVQELLSLRADLRKHLDDVQAQLRTRVEKLEAERKAVLDAIADVA